MTARSAIVAALLRLYPAEWRAEYGPELDDILSGQPLTARVIGDVLWSAAGQRARAAEPSTVLGVTSMAVVLGAFAMTGASYGRDWTAVLQPTAMTLPTVTVTFMASGYYLLLLVACGCWTSLRHRGGVRRSGLAGIRMSLIAGVPVALGAVLMMGGLLSLRCLSPDLHPPSATAVLLAPLFRLPEAGLWGAIGGQLGRWIVRRRGEASVSRP
jgi:hypothetical protein